MVIHAIGIDPNVDNKEIASVFGIGLQPQGFIGKGQCIRCASAKVPAGRIRRGCCDRTRDDRRFDCSSQGGRDCGVRARCRREGACRARSDRSVTSMARAHAAPVAARESRPTLELSGPKLRTALESLVVRSEEYGGVERYVEALKVKTALFARSLGDGRARDIEPKPLRQLLSLLATVRRRIGPGF